MGSGIRVWAVSSGTHKAVMVYPLHGFMESVDLDGVSVLGRFWDIRAQAQHTSGVLDYLVNLLILSFSTFL